MTHTRRIVTAPGDARVEALLAPTRWTRWEREDVNVCALSSGRAALHPEVDDVWYRDVAGSEGHLALLRALAFRSMLSVPLVMQGRTAGALTLFFGASGRRHTDDDLGVVQGDPGRLQQVVWNLAWNAVKFTPAGGAVTVSATRGDELVSVRVADTGQGIDAAFLPHVFDRFRHADSSSTRRHSGMGLGLAIARHLVELHGGAIAAESAGEGKGATFTLTLPTQRVRVPSVAPPRLVTPTRLPVAARRGVLAGARVLLVEDETDAREFVADLLREYGATVTEASSVDEALERFEAQTPDVVVSDIGMPGRDGYALIESLRALPPERGGAVPALALTGFARAEDARRALGAGFQRHLTKPVEPDGLVAAVVQLWEGRGGR